MSDATDTHAMSSRAFELLEAELLAIDPKTLVPLNIDVTLAAMTVLGVAEDLRSYRGALVELCGEAKVRASIDRLELVARATLHAHARYRAIETGRNLQPLVGELTAIRNVLDLSTRTLIARAVLRPAVVSELSGLNGHQNLCLDVLQLVSVFQTNWDLLRGECGVTEAYLARAETLCDRLATMIGQRQQGVVSPVGDARQRAFTLLLQTYEQARRLVTYLRWDEGDYDRVAPSLWAMRRTKRRAAGAPQAPAAPTDDAAPTDEATPE